jgi:hypothetical protein
MLNDVEGQESRQIGQAKKGTRERFEMSSLSLLDISDLLTSLSWKRHELPTVDPSQASEYINDWWLVEESISVALADGKSNVNDLVDQDEVIEALERLLNKAPS